MQLLNKENVKVVVNENEMLCPTCGCKTYNARGYRINCETGYSELYIECTCCGKIDTYNYHKAKSKISLVVTE